MRIIVVGGTGHTGRFMVPRLIEAGMEVIVAFTAIMPPNICGSGKIPLECLGGHNLEVHKAHMLGDISKAKKLARL